MVAGADLLQTHIALDPGNTSTPLVVHSEWQHVVRSPPVRAALILTLGRWARLLEASGSYFVRATAAAAQIRGIESADERDALRRLRGASESLRKASQAISSAQRSHPVSTTDLGLLYSIPLNAAPARRLPTGRETSAELRQGAINSAERVRRATHVRATDARWAPS